MHFRIIVPAVLGSLVVATHANDARACGGCFHPPSQPNQSGTVVTDHRMIFVVTPRQTTLYDEIKYSGSPANFAWVLPIRGQVLVGLSSDVVFSALEQATQTTIVAPNLPPCPVSSCSCNNNSGADASVDASVRAADAGVTVLSQQTIGPYDTVQLKSADPNALNAWLTANSYEVPADVQPVIDAYVSEGFDFLALKLAPGQGVQAMRPVRVSTPAAGLSLPLRMVAAGTGSTVGITLWIVADARYEPQNFQYFTIAPSELTWDWSISRSNYTTVRTQKEASFNNTAWQIESSMGVTPSRIENVVMQAPNDYMPLSAGDGDASSIDDGEASFIDDARTNGDTSSMSDASSTEGGGSASQQTPAQARLEDFSVLFPEEPLGMRITRMRSDLPHTALATDLVLTASADQSEISNVYQLTQAVNVPSCPTPPPCNCDTSGSSDADEGCATSASDPGDRALEFLAVGFAGMAILRTRRKQPR